MVPYGSAVPVRGCVRGHRARVRAGRGVRGGVAAEKRAVAQSYPVTTEPHSAGTRRRRAGHGRVSDRYSAEGAGDSCAAAAVRDSQEPGPRDGFARGGWRGSDEGFCAQEGCGQGACDLSYATRRACADFVRTALGLVFKR